MKRTFSIGAALLLCSAAAMAQYTNVLENGTNLIVNSAWTNDTLWVGRTTSNNTLSVVDGGMVFSTNAFVGETSTSSNNTASVTGTGSWTIEETLEIGVGTSNVVSVGGGGTLSVGNLVIQSGNEFNLDSGGTFAISTNFNAAADGFSWNDGGKLSVGGELTGMTVTNNTVRLDGGRDLTLDGGTWDISGTNLVVGYGGSGSELVVTNGAWINVGTGSTNDFAMDPDGGVAIGGTNGATMLVDNGSSVQTTGGLYIGGTNAALTGSVTITNGSTVEAESLVIGNDGSFLDIENEGTLSITGNYDYDAQKTNVNWNSGGTLSVGGTLTKSNGLDGVSRTLVVNGEDAGWDPGGDLTVSGTSNTLSIVDGAAVANDNGYVGYNTGESNNTVSVTGDGSVWENNGNVYIGFTNTSSGNAVTVSDGGRVEADGLVIEDGNSFNLDSGGTLAISGAFNIAPQTNLVWDAGGLLSLSGELSGLPTTNLVVNGMTNDYAYINGGHDIELSGAAGLLDLGETNLIVGYLSSGSDLSITNGATVVNADGYIGWGDNSANNSVLVSGSGSSWTNSGGDLYVGAYWSDTNIFNTGSGNTLTVEDDAWVNVGDVQTNLPGGGMLVASTNGAQLVVGNGTVNIEDTLYLGLDTNTTGTNIIRSGGTVSAGTLEIASGSLLDLRDGGTFAISTNFSASTNGFNWGEGGHLSVGGELTGMDTTNLVVGSTTNPAYYLDGGRDLTLDGGAWDITDTNLVVGYGGSGSELVVKNTGTLSSATTYIGWDTNSANNAITVSGGSTWTNSGNLWVGYGADSNKLEVSSGGSINLEDSVYIGNIDASNNSASVAGTNSLLSIAGDLVIGGSSNSVNNSLSVSDSGQVEVGGNVTLRSGNAISLASEGGISLGSTMNIYGDTAINGSGIIEFGATNATLAFLGDNVALGTNIVFSADAGFANEVIVSNGTFKVAGTNALPYENFQTLNLIDSTLNGFGTIDADTFGSINMTGGMIDPAGTNAGLLEIDGIFTPANGTEYKAQVYETNWDELVFSGAVDLTNMTAEVWVKTAPAGTVTIMSATSLANSFAETNLVDSLLLYNAVLQVTNNEVQISLEADPLESSMEFAATEMIRAGFNGMKNSVFTRTKQLRRNLVATTQAMPNEVYLLTNTNAPAGAMGPGDQNTIFDMHIWVQHYSGRGDFDSQGVADGFALNSQGTTIGADRLVGEALTLGFNYTYARASTRTTGMDDLDSETYWLGAYGEWVGKEGLYVDALVAYGLSNYDTERREAGEEEDYQGTASYDGGAFGAYADVGQYYHSGRLALSPYAGLHVLTIVTDGHDETEARGSSVYVDEVRRNLVESALGLKMRHRFDTRMGRFQTTGYAEWAHDFIEDDVSATMTASGFPSVGTTAISPDADTVNVGLGYSWISTDYLEVGIGYAGRFSENYEEHAASLMLDIMF